MSKSLRRPKKDQQGRMAKQQARRSQDASKPAAAPRVRNQAFEAGNAAMANLLNNLSGGKQLEPGLQSEMEKAYGADFDNVRIHDDAGAQAQAEDAGAIAYAHDEHIFLGADAPSLQSAAGKKLLAHELAHVVQKQKAGTQQSGAISREGDDFEVAANRAAARVLTGQRVDLSGNIAPPAIQRQDKSLIENLIDKGLREGISYTDKGWAVGGVPVKYAEQGAEVLAKIAKGDIQGAIDLVKPKDAEEEKRLEEKFRKIKEAMDALKPPDERKREEEDKKRRYDEMIEEEAKRFRKPDFDFKLSEPKFGEGFGIGPTTDYVLDDFDLEKSTLKTKHQSTLKDLADRAISNPNAEIEIVGHADTTGGLAFNKTLSEARAQAVRDYLIGRGVESAKIKSTTGKGMEEPLVTEKNDNDRARNRRVEIRYWAGVVERKKKTYGFGLGELKLNP